MVFYIPLLVVSLFIASSQTAPSTMTSAPYSSSSLRRTASGVVVGSTTVHLMPNASAACAVARPGVAAARGHDAVGAVLHGFFHCRTDASQLKTSRWLRAVHLEEDVAV